MIFFFHSDCGKENISLKGDEYKHIIKVRRQKIGDTLLVRRNNSKLDYHYTITAIDPKKAYLTLIKSVEPHNKPLKPLHLAWSMIEPKSIEKVLPMLSELGVTKITLIYAQRSQKNYKLDYDRAQTILENSMQQSGRTEILTIASCNSLIEFIDKIDECLVLDFCETTLGSNEKFETILIGPEGGFDKEEKLLLEKFTVRKLNTQSVLKSMTIAVAISSIMSL